jgi:hypothetical protein
MDFERPSTFERMRRIWGWSSLTIGLLGFISGLGSWGFSSRGISGLITTVIWLCIIGIACWLIPEAWIREPASQQGKGSRWIRNIDRSQMLARLRGESGQVDAVIRLDSLDREEFERFTYLQMLNFRSLLAGNMVKSWPYIAAAAVRAVERSEAPGFDALVGAIARDNEVMEPLRGVARRCLPKLKQYTEHARAQGLLLRPASESAESDQALLRPATEAPTQVDSLLRVGERPSAAAH